jgi:hypothetical protein
MIDALEHAASVFGRPAPAGLPNFEDSGDAWDGAPSTLSCPVATLA